MKNLELAKKIAAALQKNEAPPLDLVEKLKASHPYSRVMPDKKGRGWLFSDRARNELWHLEVVGDECAAYDSLDWDRFLAVERMMKVAPEKRNLAMAKRTASPISNADLREKARATILAIHV